VPAGCTSSMAASENGRLKVIVSRVVRMCAP
jgi:hypothetical protein